MPAAPESRAGRAKILIYLTPLCVLLLVVLVFYSGLGLNPRLVPSPLVGQPAPEFSLPRLKNADDAFMQSVLQREVSLLNIWATWCVSCRQEHPTLMKIAASDEVPVYGLLYKDEPARAVQWLQERGDPYRANAVDADGRVAIEWGVYGTPETFVIDARGIIRYKHVGPISWDEWETVILPLVRSLREQGGSRAHFHKSGNPVDNLFLVTRKVCLTGFPFAREWRGRFTG